MQPLAAGGLAESLQAQRLQPFGDRQRALDHVAETQVGRRIEIEHQPARQLGLAGLAVPGMQLGGAALARRHQPFDLVDLQVGLLVAFDLHLFQEIGTARHGVALEEDLAADAVGRAHQRARPTPDVVDHPRADRLVVLRQLELGDRRLFVRPQGLVGMRDRHAHDHGRPGRLGGARLGRRWLARRCLRDWLGHLRLRRLDGCLRLDLVGRLVLAQPLERGLPHIAAAGPAGELDLGHQLGPCPMNAAFPGRAGAGGERAGLAFDRPKLGQQPANLRFAEAGADLADIDQLLAAMDADQQGTHLLGFAGPAADHHLMAGAGLDLQPVSDAARSVGRGELLGDDAFEAHARSRFQHGRARGLEMLDIAQRRMLALEPVQQLLQPRLALAERQGAQILAVGEQQIEGEEDQGVGLALRKGCLQGAEIRHAALVERHRLAVDHAVRQALGLLGDGGKFRRPVQPLAGAQHRLAVLDAQLQAIAVELDLVRPAGAAGRLLVQLGELRLDEFGHRRDLAGLGLGGRDGGLLAAILLVALPHRAGRALLAGHERRRRPARAERDLLQGAARGDRLGILQKRVLVALVGELVAMLDQQPVGALAAAASTLLAVPFHAHQHPAAMQALAFEDELEVALLQAFMRIALRRPVAAVPQLHRAAAILAFRNGALEVAVVERMVLDLDRQALDRRDRATGPWSPPTT